MSHLFLAIIPCEKLNGIFNASHFTINADGFVPYKVETMSDIQGPITELDIYALLEQISQTRLHSEMALNGPF